jgi:hypothetical protein
MPCGCTAQTVTFWIWIEYPAAGMPSATARIVWMNMDGTVTDYGYAGNPGTILRRTKKTQPDPIMRANIPVSQCRGLAFLHRQGDGPQQ